MAVKTVANSLHTESSGCCAVWVISATPSNEIYDHVSGDVMCSTALLSLRRFIVFALVAVAEMQNFHP